ncbi:hypothetical protein J437_LFUL012729 [Ladona fulva]|uniref:Uncharacterized protein n=1 Tax=Ladona fulva TaxID=123851 RepID=A0A8K0KPP1_LADFU|nr:hypothetical protein J437_LFUL012729 [Ladona fulva]
MSGTKKTLSKENDEELVLSPTAPFSFGGRQTHILFSSIGERRKLLTLKREVAVGVVRGRGRGGVDSSQGASGGMLPLDRGNETFQKLHRTIKSKCQGILIQCIVLIHDNA